MAAFCEQHGGSFVLPAPVSAHIAVRKVPVCDVFVVLDEHYLAQHAGSYYVVYAPVIIGISQNVADEHFQPLFPRLFFYGETFGYIGTDGLFQKQVIAQIERLHGVPVMVPVLGGDDHDVGDFTLREKLLVVGKAAFVGHAPLFLYVVYLCLIFVAYGNYLHALGICKVRAVISSSAA